MTDKKYTPEELEKMADSMLKESASGKPGKGTLDEKAIERAMQNLTAQFERQCGAHIRA